MFVLGLRPVVGGGHWCLMARSSAPATSRREAAARHRDAPCKDLLCPGITPNEGTEEISMQTLLMAVSWYPQTVTQWVVALVGLVIIVALMQGGGRDSSR